MTISLERRPDWSQHAACRGLTHLFFPETGDSRTAQTAKEICHNKCPVRLQCLEAALVMESDICGVFGGCSVLERDLIRRQRKLGA